MGTVFDEPLPEDFDFTRYRHPDELPRRIRRNRDFRERYSTGDIVLGKDYDSIIDSLRDKITSLSSQRFNPAEILNNFTLSPIAQREMEARQSRIDNLTSLADRMVSGDLAPFATDPEQFNRILESGSQAFGRTRDAAIRNSIGELNRRGLFTMGGQTGESGPVLDAFARIEAETFEDPLNQLSREFLIEQEFNRLARKQAMRDTGVALKQGLAGDASAMAQALANLDIEKVGLALKDKGINLTALQDLLTSTQDMNQFDDEMVWERVKLNEQKRQADQDAKSAMFQQLGGLALGALTGGFGGLAGIGVKAGLGGALAGAGLAGTGSLGQAFSLGNLQNSLMSKNIPMGKLVSPSVSSIFKPNVLTGTSTLMNPGINPSANSFLNSVQGPSSYSNFKLDTLFGEK